MAGGIDWFRWHHGSVTDPKFQLVARKAGVRLPDVLAVWAFALEHASAADDRGCFGELDCEAIDCLFGLDDGKTGLILEQMGVRGLVDEGRVTSWDKRQPKRERESDNSAERTRAYRERQKDAKKTSGATVTPSDAMSHQEAPREEESREDNSSLRSENTHSGDSTDVACVSSTEAGLICRSMKSFGISDVNPGHLDLKTLIEAGAAIDEFEGAAREAVSKKKGFAYAIGIVRKRREEAARAPPMHQGPMTSRSQSQNPTRKHEAHHVDEPA